MNRKILLAIIISCATLFLFSLCVTAVESAVEEYIAEEIKSADSVEMFHLELLNEGGFPSNHTFSKDYSIEASTISQALFNREAVISFNSNIPPDELARLYERVVNAEPELFYVSDSVKIDTTASGCVIYPVYDVATVGLYAYDDGVEFRKEVNKILSYVHDEMNDLEKALAVHDYFVRNYHYDMRYYNGGSVNYDIEELFTDKYGVCQAYADGYTYIMNKKLGIPCYTLSSEEINHAWNVILIDGEWYHVDATWDDPVEDYFGASRHNYFLLSSDTIRDAEHRHDTYDWCVSGYSDWKYSFDVPSRVVEPTSERFDHYTWTKTGRSPFIYYEGEWYYVSQGKLYRFDIHNDTSTSIKTLYSYSSSWDLFDIYLDTIIYKGYWDETVYLFPMNGSGSRTIAALNGIYGFRLNSNKLEYEYEDQISNDSAFHVFDLNTLEYQVAKPVATVIAGSSVNINPTSATDGAMIYYSLDGSTPSTSLTSGNDITVDNNGEYKIKLMAAKNGYNNSDITTIIIKKGRQIIMGDALGDGLVNSKDAIKLNQYLAKWSVTFENDEDLAADIVNDGLINSKDVIKLNQYLAKWNVTLD